MRGKRLGRLLQIIALLRGSSSWNARRLADHFQTSRRNIHRDMAVLELAGVPFYHDPEYGETGGYRIHTEWWFPATSLTEQQCIDLAVLTRIAETKAVSLLDSACEVRDKILGTLPVKQQDLIRTASELFDILSLQAADHSHCRSTMMTIQKALLTQKQIKGKYDSPHKKRPVAVQLQPRRVFLCGAVGAWYLSAHDNKAGETKLYRVARFENVELMDKPIDVDEPWSLREYLGNAWTVHRGERDYHIEIQFEADAAGLVEETRWHHTQELERKRDGSLLFRVTVSGLDEIKYWILNWGPRATVLKPRELQLEIKRLAEAIAGRYSRQATIRRKR